MVEQTETRVNQYLTFRLGQEVFASPVGQVREVLDLLPITKVPQTPDFMCGVINMRGGVVPIIDMHLKFNLPQVEQTVDTCIIVIEVILEDETIVLGMLADAVDEVVELEPDQIEPPPRLGMQIDTEFIRGMGKKDERFIIILDIDRVFSSEELAEVSEAVE